MSLKAPGCRPVYVWTGSIPLWDMVSLLRHAPLGRASRHPCRQARDVRPCTPPSPHWGSGLSRYACPVRPNYPPWAILPLSLWPLNCCKATSFRLFVNTTALFVICLEPPLPFVKGLALFQNLSYQIRSLRNWKIYCTRLWQESRKVSHLFKTFSYRSVIFSAWLL